jgi:hypothetical protein
MVAVPLESEFLWAKRAAKIVLVSLLHDQNTCVVSTPRATVSRITPSYDAVRHKEAKDKG